MLRNCIRTGLFCLLLLGYFLTGMSGSGLETADARTWDSSEVWPAKAWTVQFSQVLDAGSVTPQTVYVLDSQGQMVPHISLQVNGDIISVGLTEGYSYPLGNYSLVVAPGIRAANGNENTEFVTKPFTVLGPTYFTFQNGSMPAGLADNSYAVRLEGTELSGASWAIGQGSELPAGLLLHPATGEIKGVPLKAGSYQFHINRTSPTGIAEEKVFSMEILPSDFTKITIEPFSFNQGEQPQSVLAELNYKGRVKKNIEVYWDPTDSRQAGDIGLYGYLGGSDYRVEVQALVSHLKNVDFKYYYWSPVNWRTVIVELDGKVRDAYMDASYLDRSRTRKMDYMKSLSELWECNVFGVNTNALNPGSSVTFRFYDAFGSLLEKHDMLVDD